MEVKKSWLATQGEQDIFLVSLINDSGMVVNVLNYGAVIKDILVSRYDKTQVNLVLNYDTLEHYYNDMHYLGCVIGRYANRISGGRCPINDNVWQLSTNENNTNHLHGGFKGFNRKIWSIKQVFNSNDRVGVTLLVNSAHLEEGYPGNLSTEVTYTLSNSNELMINYKATTDQPTVVNLTNHTYFNLTGAEKDISSSMLCVNAGYYTESNEQYIPGGKLNSVNNSVYDLRVPIKVSSFMHHIPTINYCLNNKKEFKQVAMLIEPTAGIGLEVRTTAPGLQLYCGNYLSGKYKPFWGICLEPHYYPDSPNHPEFPSTLLLPGQTYQEATSYKIVILIKK